jgi:hypothetical protein
LALGMLGAVVAAVVLLGSGSSRVRARPATPSVPEIAHRVEAIRELEFTSLPKVERVTRRQLEAKADREVAGLSDRDRARLEAGAEVGRLLGFEAPDAGKADGADVSGILGSYDPKAKTLTIVTDAQGERDQAELTIAHELLHALEDQTFGLGDPGAASNDDAAAAHQALGEGSARIVETEYARRHLDGRMTTGDIARRKTTSTRKAAPDYAENTLRFAYVDGARFVARLKREGGWKLVNEAYRSRPPRSTEHIFHPEAYLRGEPARPVALDVRRIAGPRFRRLAAGTFGEFDTGQLLAFGAGTDDETTRADATRAASGWAGGRYELWRAGRGTAGCSKPCVERDVLVIGWRWDTARDAAQFVRLLAPYLEEFQELRSAGPGLWRGDVASAALVAQGGEATLAIAPAPGLARLLSARARP